MKPTGQLLVLAYGLLAFALAIPTAQQHVKADLVSSKERVTAPLFRLPDATSRPVQLADFRGKPVVVNLWATACGGCRIELPIFVKLDAAYRDRGVAVIGVSMDILYSGLATPAEAWALVSPFVRQRNIEYPIVMDDGTVEKGLSVRALPATYLIDKAGRIAATYIGVVDGSDLESNVKALLAER